MEWWTYLISWAVVSGIVGAFIGDRNDRGSAGFFLGFFLGVIGWMLAFGLEPSKFLAAVRERERQQEYGEQARAFALALGQSAGTGRTCPMCAERIQAEAVLCRFCGADVSATAAQWLADPANRFELRYWDGQSWTPHVSGGGEVGLDPI